MFDLNDTEGELQDLDKWDICFVIYIFLSNNPSSGEKNSSNVSCCIIASSHHHAIDTILLLHACIYCNVCYTNIHKSVLLIILIAKWLQQQGAMLKA